MNFLRFTSILLAFILILPGYAAETIMLPAQEESPANIQHIDSSEPEQEEASEEPEQELEFLETTKGKAVTLAAILASLGLGTGFYFYLKKMREKKEKQEQERQEHEQRFEEEQKEEQKRLADEEEKRKEQELLELERLEQERNEEEQTDEQVQDLKEQARLKREQRKKELLELKEERRRSALLRKKKYFEKEQELGPIEKIIDRHSDRSVLREPAQKILKYFGINPEDIQQEDISSGEISQSKVEHYVFLDTQVSNLKAKTLQERVEALKKLGLTNHMDYELGIDLGIDIKTGNLSLMLGDSTRQAGRSLYPHNYSWHSIDKSEDLTSLLKKNSESLLKSAKPILDKLIEELDVFNQKNI